jgi:hypothetical protein
MTSIKVRTGARLTHPIGRRRPAREEIFLRAGAAPSVGAMRTRSLLISLALSSLTLAACNLYFGDHSGAISTPDAGWPTGDGNRWTIDASGGFGGDAGSGSGCHSPDAGPGGSPDGGAPDDGGWGSGDAHGSAPDGGTGSGGGYPDAG